MLIHPTLFNKRTGKEIAESFDENQNENVWIGLTTENRKNHIVGVFYKILQQLMSNFFEWLNTAIHKRLTKRKFITIIGDFNINFLSPTEQMNMNSVVTLYNFPPGFINEATQISRRTSSLSNYIITDKLKNFQYNTDTLLSSDPLGHTAILDGVITMKQKTRIRATLDKTLQCQWIQSWFDESRLESKFLNQFSESATWCQFQNLLWNPAETCIKKNSIRHKPSQRSNKE